MIRKPLIIIVLSFLSLLLFSEGRRENRDYRDDLDKAFVEILTLMESDMISAGEGKGRLETIRNHYGFHYTDEAGVMDALLDSVDEGRLTIDEARIQFGLLTEGRLMDYRAEQRDIENEAADDGKPKSGGESSGKGEATGGGNSAEQENPNSGKNSSSSGKSS